MIQKIYFYIIIKIINFRDDINDISVIKAALVRLVSVAYLHEEGEDSDVSSLEGGICSEDGRDV